MLYIKKVGKALLYMLIPLLIITLIFTLLNYLGIISYKVMDVIKFITLIVSIFIGGFIFGKDSKEKGLIEGIKLGVIVIVILVLFNYLIFNIPFAIKHLIYYSTILGSSILGSILGINKKASSKN